MTFQVGDTIRRRVASRSHQYGLRGIEEGIVEGMEGRDPVVNGWAHLNSSVELVERATSDSPFQVGDRVRRVRGGSYNSVQLGDDYTVRRLRPDGIHMELEEMQWGAASMRHFDLVGGASQVDVAPTPDQMEKRYMAVVLTSDNAVSGRLFLTREEALEAAPEGGVVHILETTSILTSNSVEV